jgi:hypothetical protein
LDRSENAARCAVAGGVARDPTPAKQDASAQIGDRLRLRFRRAWAA